MYRWTLHATDGHTIEVIFKPLLEIDTLMTKWTRGIDWKDEVKASKMLHNEVFKLINLNNNEIIGAISIQAMEGYAYINFLEVKPEYRVSHRVYTNAAEIIIGFAGCFSRMIGGEGYICFKPKSRLRNYYSRRFNAVPGGVGQYIINDDVTKHLFRLYCIK